MPEPESSMCLVQQPSHKETMPEPESSMCLVQQPSHKAVGLRLKDYQDFEGFKVIEKHIKKGKTESNGESHKYEMAEALRSTLPVYLQEVVQRLLNGLVAQLQPVHGGRDRVDNSSLKRALEVLHECQHRLSVHVLEMSFEKQLYYSFMVHSMSESLVKYQSSLELLQSSPEVHMLVALLLGMGSGSAEEGSCEQLVGDDVLSVVVPAFGSMVLEHGIVLVQNPTVMKAFQKTELYFQYEEWLKRALEHYSKQIAKSFAVYTLPLQSSELKENLQEEDRDSTEDLVMEALDYIDDTECFGRELTEKPHEEEKVGTVKNQTILLKALLHSMYQDTGMNISSFSFLDGVSPSTEGGLTSSGSGKATLLRAVPKDDWEMMKLLLKEGFSSFSKSIDKLLVREDRDGSKLIVSEEVALITNVIVGSSTGVEFRYFETRASQSSIVEELVSLKRGEPTEVTHVKKLCTREDRCVDTWLYISSRQLTNNTHLEQLGTLDESQLLSCPEGLQYQLPLPPPHPPPPPTLWCWKRRLESVDNPYHYIASASRAALEQLDTECQETICHAVASDCGAGPTPFQLLLQKVSCSLLIVQDKHGNTPLHNAASAGNVVIVGMLASLHLSAIHTQNFENLTPLDIAVSHRNDEVVECLLRQCLNSDPHSTKNVQLLQSCLLKAMKTGYTSFLKMFLQLRSEYRLAIDFECTDSEGCSAWHYLTQTTPAVRAGAVELLKVSDLGQPLLTKLLKLLNVHPYPEESTSAAKSVKVQTVSLDAHTTGSIHASSTEKPGKNTASEIETKPNHTPLTSLSGSESQTDIHVDCKFDYMSDSDELPQKTSGSLEHERKAADSECVVGTEPSSQPELMCSTDAETSCRESGCDSKYEVAPVEYPTAFQPEPHTTEVGAATSTESELTCPSNATENEGQEEEPPSLPKEDPSTNPPTVSSSESSKQEVEEVGESIITGSCSDGSVSLPGTMAPPQIETEKETLDSTCDTKPDTPTSEVDGPLGLRENYEGELQVTKESGQYEIGISPEEMSAEQTKQFPAEAAEPLTPELIAMIEKLLKEKNYYRAEMEKMKGKIGGNSQQHSQGKATPDNPSIDSQPSQPLSLSSSEFSDMPFTTGSALPAAQDDYTSIEESEDRTGKQKPLRYQQPYTDSVTSSSSESPPAQKLSLSSHPNGTPPALQSQAHSPLLQCTENTTPDKPSIESQHSTSLSYEDCPCATLNDFEGLEVSESQPSSFTSETSSGLELRVPPPNPEVAAALKSGLVLNYSSTATEESNDARMCVAYQQPYTDSVTSSACNSPLPRRRSLPHCRLRQRAQASRRLLKYRLTSSGSDTVKGKDRKSHRKPQKRVRRRTGGSESYTEPDVSVDSSEDSSSDSGLVSDGQEIEATGEMDRIEGHQEESVESKAVLPTQLSWPGRINLCWLSLDSEPFSDEPRIEAVNGINCIEDFQNLGLFTQQVLQLLFGMVFQLPRCRELSYKCTSVDFFSPASFCTMQSSKISFDAKKFETWLSSAIHKSTYDLLKDMVPPKYRVVFGFDHLTKEPNTLEMKFATVVVSVVLDQSKCNSIPENVSENLQELKKIVLRKKHSIGFSCEGSSGISSKRGKRQKLQKKDVLQTGNLKTKTLKALPAGAEGESAATPLEGCASPPSQQLPTQCREESSSAGLSVLEFTNSSSPLDVIHSHLNTYRKCCPRHDIRNILTICPTCPPSDAFGPKRRYSSIKDIQSDPSHSEFDGFKELSVQSSASRHYRESKSHQVMFERPNPKSLLRPNRGALLPKLLPQITQTHTETEPHSFLPHSSKQPTSQLHPSIPHSRVSEATVAIATREPSVETRPKHPEPSTRLETPPTSSRNSSIPSHQHTSLLDSHAVPQDHKERLRSSAELLHAQDYNRILPLAYEGEPPDSLPPELKIPYVFVTGLAYYKLSNHKKSVQYFSRCLRLADECGRDGDVTICNIYLGDVEFAKRRYPEAAGRYRTALHHYSRDSVAKDFRMVMPTQSAVWLKCGSAFKNASRVGDSVAAYEKAVELATAHSSKKDQLSAHTSLGNLYQGIGENGRAVKEYEAAIKLAEDLKDNVSLGWNHGNLGNALLGLHQRDKALHHLFKALDMAVEYETTPQAIGRAFNNLGTAFQSLNELSKAEEHYDFALAQAIYGNDIPGQARVYGNIGNLQMLNKQYEKAVPHYTEVMRLSQDKATITTAHHNRGCAYYDWAEKRKMAGGTTTRGPEIKGPKAPKPPNTSHSSSSEDESKSYFKVSLHGPDLEDCEVVYRPSSVDPNVQKYYLQGTRDLEYVIKHHEESFNGIKGSPKGLSLSVSLFETNSRTFHRMQDCLVHLQEEDSSHRPRQTRFKEPRKTRFEDALVVAEQSRARTLGELLLKRRGLQLEHELVSPPSLDQMKAIVGQQNCPVVYLSYTGERLLGWLLYPTSNGEASVNMFEIPLSDNEFDGKSLDYHLRYSLNEQLVEKSFEMYKPFDHEKEKTEPLEKLYDLVARPVMAMISTLDKAQQEKEGASQHHKRDPEKKERVRKIVVVPDSYTNLLPFTCVLNRDTGKFWGDEFYFQIMPSLLTMGILDQLPTVSVAIPVEFQQMLCVVGNPNIPRFTYNGEDWDLGKLPHATREAEWVSHILQCNPILHEQATKDAVLMRIMNAKVIHLATHGSAVAGFLAFAGISSSSSEAVDAKKVLIYPEEVESLNISPALVVLSSCDSGRGVFKADGIQGMARAFILAGAQAVLTALWRVPDESACIFMQFFYQYLVEGMRGTEALHKAILCLRCFSKYSQYIHWSGYQLTGREFQFSVSHTSVREELSTRLGTSSIFPRLEILKELEKAFLDSPRLPTDVQVLHGPPGVKPSEPLVDFIHCHHAHFSGGIFWINCRSPQLIEASLTSIKNSLGLKEIADLPCLETQPILMVLYYLDHFPKDDCPLLHLLRHSSIHIVVVSRNAFPEQLQKSADHQLIRGTNIINIQPLSTIHATQRLVHSALQGHHLAPSKKEQVLFEKLAEFTTGSPPIIDLTTSLLDQSLGQADSSTEALDDFASEVRLSQLPLQKPQSVPREHLSSLPQERFLNVRTRDVSQELYESIRKDKGEEEDVFKTSARYDSWQVVTVLIDHSQLSPEERLLLFCLATFNCCPVPTSYVTEIATIITKASHRPHLASTLHSKLQVNKILKVYPKPLIYHPSHPKPSAAEPSIDFVYVPRFISAAVWKDMMSDIDKVMALTTCYKALQHAVSQQNTAVESGHLLGVGSILVESFELNFKLVGRACFQQVYSLFIETHRTHHK